MKIYFQFISLLIIPCCFLNCNKDDGTQNPGPTPCILSMSEQQVVDELNDNYAYAFAGAQPGVKDPGLDPLIDYLGDSPLVGLGEATHGTAEFYKMKDQLFRRLVEEKDFKAIVFELPWGNAWVINEFVTKGVGTADEVIDQCGYWTYDTQEVRDLAQWIHDFNNSLPEEEQIYFVGCDPQGSSFSEERALISAYLSKVQPDSVIEIFKHYNDLPRGDLSDYVNAETSIKQQNIAGTQKVYDHFVRHRSAFIAASSELEYEIAWMATHVIQHREYIYRIGNSGVPRDSLMAIYVEWWQRILGNDVKVAIWAHNFHVMDAAVDNLDWMGTYLRRRNGDDYRNVAFSFSAGSFNAFKANAMAGFAGPVQRQSIPSPVCQTANQLLDSVSGNQHYIIFSELQGESRSYFNAAQPFYQLGAGFNFNYLSFNYTQPRRLSRLWDVLIHFDKTRASDLQ